MSLGRRRPQDRTLRKPRVVPWCEARFTRAYSASVMRFILPAPARREAVRQRAERR